MITLKPCPFCGFHPGTEEWCLIDSLHPTGAYVHWMDPNDHDMGVHFNREREGAVHEVWEMNCLESSGGCGAEVHGYGRDGAIAAWNRRPGDPSHVEPVNPYHVGDWTVITAKYMLGKKELVIDLGVVLHNQEPVSMRWLKLEYPEHFTFTSYKAWIGWTIKGVEQTDESIQEKYGLFTLSRTMELLEKPLREIKRRLPK